MTNSFISPNLLMGEKQNISIRKSKKSLLFAIILLLIGIICIPIIVMLPQETKDAFSISLVVLSGTSIIIAILELCFGRKTYIYKPTNSQIHGRVFFCTSGKGQEAIRAIQTENWTLLQKLMTPNESSVKLEFIASKDRKMAYCQILTFIPYSFEPLSDVLPLSPEAIEELLKISGTKF